MKRGNILRSEEGSILIVALIMLVLLTLMGISATKTANVEIQIAGNDKTYKENFYKAEASAMEAIQQMEDTDLEDSPPSWLLSDSTSFVETSIRTESFWNPGSGTAPSAIDSSNARYYAVHDGIVETGESLDMIKTKIHAYRVYGRCSRNNGVSIIKVGYRKAF